jgi:hypothetical protein
MTRIPRIGKEIRLARAIREYTRPLCTGHFLLA